MSNHKHFFKKKGGSINRTDSKNSLSIKAELPDLMSQLNIEHLNLDTKQFTSSIDRISLKKKQIIKQKFEI